MSHALMCLAENSHTVCSAHTIPVVHTTAAVFGIHAEVLKATMTAPQENPHSRKACAHNAFMSAYEHSL